MSLSIATKLTIFSYSQRLTINAHLHFCLMIHEAAQQFKGHNQLGDDRIFFLACSSHLAGGATCQAEFERLQLYLTQQMSDVLANAFHHTTWWIK